MQILRQFNFTRPTQHCRPNGLFQSNLISLMKSIKSEFALSWWQYAVAWGRITVNAGYSGTIWTKSLNMLERASVGQSDHPLEVQYINKDNKMLIHHNLMNCLYAKTIIVGYLDICIHIHYSVTTLHLPFPLRRIFMQGYRILSHHIHHDQQFYYWRCIAHLHTFSFLCPKMIKLRIM